MDAVLEPFPADRLFPGSSFLDLGDLNESDFLNNAVRRRVSVPVPPLGTLLRGAPGPLEGPDYTSLGRSGERVQRRVSRSDMCLELRDLTSRSLDTSLGPPPDLSLGAGASARPSWGRNP